jgi:hypothetical protein
MQETTQKCADRISEALKNREQDIKFLMSSDSDEDYQQLCELPLGIETVKETTVTLSWGGPADYLHIIHADGEVKRVTYRYSDWFDTAIDELDETSPLWDYAESIVESLELD